MSTGGVDVSEHTKNENKNKKFLHFFIYLEKKLVQF